MARIVFILVAFAIFQAKKSLHEEGFLKLSSYYAGVWMITLSAFWVYCAIL